MHLTRFDPFRELEEMSSRLGRFFGKPLQPRDDADGFGLWAPPLDVQETEKEYLIKADLPAVGKEDVKVAIEDGILTVEGERKQEQEEKGKRFHRVERTFGRFVRRLSVPSDVEPGTVTADFKDGVLSVHLPKLPSAKPRAIDVQVM
jgi:HSP20 family protein